MWILFQQPDEFLDQIKAERERHERIANLTRALRGATPPFDATIRSQLQRAMADQPSSGQLAVGRS